MKRLPTSWFVDFISFVTFEVFYMGELYVCDDSFIFRATCTVVLQMHTHMSFGFVKLKWCNLKIYIETKLKAETGITVWVDGET